MQLKVSNFQIPKDLTLSKPLEDESILLTADIENVDRVGFDLTTLEQEYYKVNKLALSEKVIHSKDSNKQSWNTIFQNWFLTREIQEHIYIDHCGIYGTYPFSGQAKKQIKKYIPKRPELAKLLNLRGKVGYDICIDYINGEEVVELLHIEHDYGLEEYDTYLKNKHRLEAKLLNTNWERIYEKVKKGSLLSNSIQRNNFKSSLFGFEDAFKYYNRL